MYQKTATAIKEIVVERHKAGRVTEVDALYASAIELEVRIALLNEQLKVKSSK
jgi:hypothetical protein